LEVCLNLPEQFLWKVLNGEVKLGNKQIEEAAANLIKLSQKVDVEKMNQPSFLMVLTGGQAAYRRPDGLLVVPISCFRD
jgi:hypothetical protein